MTLEEQKEHDRMVQQHDTFVLHLSMIGAALIVLVVAMMLHHFRPEDNLYEIIAVTALGFLFGKFTNSFGSLLPKRRG